MAERRSVQWRRRRKRPLWCQLPPCLAVGVNMDGVDTKIDGEVELTSVRKRHERGWLMRGEAVLGGARQQGEEVQDD